jgi:hypothetical protein
MNRSRVLEVFFSSDRTHTVLKTPHKLIVSVCAGRSGKTNGIVQEAKCAPAEGKNFSGKKRAGAKLNMPA